VTSPARPPRPTNPEYAEFERIRRRLAQALAALVIVTMIGVVGFSIIGKGRYSLIDAAYMTVITLTTVGYGEIIDMSQNPAGRVFTMGLLLTGMGIVAYTVPLLAAFFIEGQVNHIFLRRRMDKQIAQLREHYVVCGDIAATWYVAEELKRTDRPFVLVVPTEGVLREALERLGEVPRIVGDPSDDDALLAAGVDRCAGVVVVMESDKDNVLVALTARRLAPRARIVASTESREAEAKLRTAGADAVVSPARTGGLRIASELVRPKVVSFLDQMLRDTRSSLRVEEVTVPSGAPAVGKSLGALGIDDVVGALLLAIRDPATGAFTFKPSGDTPVRANTTLVVMVDAEGRTRLEERLRS
jgi:voltage-gated potassium channel